jgi:hypothetical protein
MLTEIRKLNWDASDIIHDVNLDPQTVTFEHKVVQAEACIVGFKLEHIDGDHHTMGQQVLLNTTIKAPNQVTVTPKVGMWDKHKDRRFDAEVEAVVIAVCENK